MSSSVCYSQHPLIKQFNNKIDFSILAEVVKMSADDTVFVSNSRRYDVLNFDNRFYFYNKKIKGEVFPEGYEMKIKIIPYGYEGAYPFVGESAIVKYNDNWGLINRSGKFIFYKQTGSAIKRLSSYEKFAIFDVGNDEETIYSMQTGKQQSGYVYCAEPGSPDFYVHKTVKNKYQLIRAENREPVFKTELDSIIVMNNLIYNDNQNLIILKKKNKYGLSLSNSNEILKIKYGKAKFLGEYIMFFEKGKWNYYVFENNKLTLLVSTEIECFESAYQKDFIGIFKKNEKYNLLKRNGETLETDFDYLFYNGAIGIKDDAVVTLDSNGSYYYYYDTKSF